MKNKTFIFCIVGLLAVCGLRAEDSIPARPDILQDMPYVEIIQDSAMIRLLNAAIVGTHELEEVDGYRVQIYSSNQQQSAKAEALRLENQMKDKLTQSVYVLYVPPFWKVRVGDFRTADEAKEYKKAVIQEFPELVGNTYIVRDRVQVLK